MRRRRKPSSPRSPSRRNTSRGRSRRGRGPRRGRGRARGRGRGKSRERTPSSKRSSPKERNRQLKKQSPRRGRGRGHLMKPAHKKPSSPRSPSRGRGKSRGRTRSSKRSSPRGRGRRLGKKSPRRGRGRGHLMKPTHKNPSQSLNEPKGIPIAQRNNLFSTKGGGGSTKSKSLFSSGGSKRKESSPSSSSTSSSTPPLPPPPPKRNTKLHHFERPSERPKDIIPAVVDSTSSHNATMMIESLEQQKNEIESKYEMVNDQLHDLMAEKEEEMRKNEDLRKECAELRDESIKMLNTKVTDDELLQKQEEMTIKYNLLIDSKDELLKRNEELIKECATLKAKSKQPYQRRSGEIPIHYRDGRLEFEKWGPLKKENEYSKRRMLERNMSVHGGKGLNGMINDRNLQSVLRENKEIRQIYEDVSWRLTKANKKFSDLKKEKSESATYIEKLSALQKQYDELLKSNKALTEKYQELEKRYKAKTKLSNRYKQKMDDLQRKYDELKAKEHGHKMHKSVRIHTKPAFVAPSCNISDHGSTLSATQSYHSSDSLHSTVEHLSIDDAKNQKEYREKLRRNHTKSAFVAPSCNISDHGSTLSATQSYHSSDSLQSTFEHLSIDDAKNQREYMEKLRRNHERYKMEKQRQIDAIRRKLEIERNKNKKLRHDKTQTKSHSVHRNVYESKEAESMDDGHSEPDQLMNQILNLKERIEEYVDAKGEIMDSVTIIGKETKFKNVQIIANENGVQIGADTFGYNDIISLFRCKDSETEWIMTTNNFMVQILASSSKMRDRFVSFIQSHHLQFL